MAKFRRARPTHMDERPATRRHAHRDVTVGLQHAPQGRPVAVVAFLFERVGDKAQKLISQDREEDVRVDAALQLMIIGAQAQIAFERGKAILGAAEQDVELPQLFRAQLRAVRVSALPYQESYFRPPLPHVKSYQFRDADRPPPAVSYSHVSSEAANRLCILLTKQSNHLGTI